MPAKEVSLSKRLKAALKDYIKKTDLVLLGLALLSAGYGMVLVGSASNNSAPVMTTQGAAIFLGVILYFFITLFDVEHISALWKWAFAFNLLLLSTTLFFGQGMAETGNNSWIRFSLLGASTGIQPAEVGKVIYVFTLAAHFRALGSGVNTFKGLALIFLHAALPVACVYLFSKDDGMAVSYVFIFVIMAFAGGIKLRYCLAGLGALVASVPLLWGFVMGQYQKDRFIVLFDAEYKLDSVGYHQLQSKTAIANGGLLGRGLGNGPLTQYGHLPAKRTDFIFSVACEELGFLGGFAIIALLTAVIIKLVKNALSMRDDKFSLLMCLGLGAMFTFQTYINIGMNIGVAPVVGLTLPFFSYGGTSVLTMFIAVGLVSSLKRHYIKKTFSVDYDSE